MAYKTLGQVAPAATTATTLYTVPAGKTTVVSTLTVCNRGAAATYRVSIRPAGAAQANEHYVMYEVTLPGLATDFFTVGFTLGATDVVTVYASTADMSFGLFGDES